MTTAQRREEILALLNQADAPIAAKDLAARFGVSRQVIVQDLAVIRASRPNIISTNRGYILQQQETGCLREFKVRHTPEQAGQELNLIVDHGGRVKNISISHRVYGRITAEMDIRSRQDVQEFLQALAGGASTVLSTATDGYHYHLVEAATPDRLDLIGQALQDAGFLAPCSRGKKKKKQHRTIPALRQTAPAAAARHCVAKMLDKTSSIICAFLASAAPRSPYRHLELCGIA